MEMKRIHINLPEDVHDALKSMCKTQCRSVSSQIQFLIRNAENSDENAAPLADG
jgi:hypothetical protein